MKIKSFNDWGVFTKIVSISIASIIILLAVVSAVLLPFMEKNLITDRQKELTNVTEIIIQLANDYNERSSKSEIAVTEAQNRFKERIRDLRYGNNEYFFVIDTNNIVIMHPFMPELEGKSGDSVTDPSGKALFTGMVAIAIQASEGIVSYMWPKPGQTAPAPKLSYIKLYRPWNWIIGTGIYVDDINREISAIRNGIFIALFTCSALIMMLSLLVARRICRPLSDAIGISTRLAKGELDCNIEVNSLDETGQLMQAMQLMIAGLRDYQHSQNMLHEYHERLAMIVEFSSDGILSLDLDRNIVTWNTGAENIFGYCEEEIIGKPVTQIFSESPLLDELNTLNVLKPDNETKQIRRTNLALEYLQKTVSVTVSPIRDRDHNIIYTSLIIRDITELRRMEDSLRKSERNYRNFFENSEVGIYRTTLDGLVTLDVNQKYLDIIGKSREEVIGQPSTTNWVEPLARAEMVRMLIEDGRVSGFEYKKMNRHNGVRNCLTSVVLYREEGIIEGSILDITDLRKAENDRETALANLKKLEGIIPICMHCKSIRNDENSWQSLETYMFEHADARFSHGICSACMEKYYPSISGKPPAN